MNGDALDTHQKALRTNLDSDKYGAFAEIGAGQEVARWFFRVGGASGNIAKTMSAYDMTVSDAIYGAADRYVSRERLQRMLEHEYSLMLERLDPVRGQTTRFFAFANTVAARSYSRDDEAHGWMGMRFQTAPGVTPSQVIVHLRLLDPENLQQQEALGIAGVNLVYAALYLANDPSRVIASLLDSLNRDRIEIDLVKFEGPAFAGVDNRLMSLELVEQRLTPATLFNPEGEVVLAAEMLYKKPILVVRGSFRPITLATVDLLESARRQFAKESDLDPEEIVVLTEMTLRHLAEGGMINRKDFLDRADTLTALGYSVLVSSHARYFRLAASLLRHTQEKIGIGMGVRRLREMFDGSYYKDLDGGILEALGRMFKNDLKLFIYPVTEGPEKRLVTATNLKVAENLKYLYAHLLQNGYIADITEPSMEYQDIFAKQIMEAIRKGTVDWEDMVPDVVQRIIKQRTLFGYGSAKET